MVLSSLHMSGYETHISVTTRDPQTLESALPAWAESNGLKFTHILLPSGRFHSQPMLTYWHTGSLEDQLSRADQIREDLIRIGAEVTRVKVEIGLDDADAPQQAANGGYFEHHAKVLIGPEQFIDDLKDTVARYDGRLSRNARRVRSDQSIERFVTLRRYEGTAHSAKDQRQQLTQAIMDAGFTVLEIEDEYVLFDSNLQLDVGWMTQGESNVV